MEKLLAYNNSFLGKYECSSLALDREERRDEKKRLDHLKKDQTMLVIKRFSKRKKENPTVTAGGPGGSYVKNTVPILLEMWNFIALWIVDTMIPIFCIAVLPSSRLCGELDLTMTKVKFSVLVKEMSPIVISRGTSLRAQECSPEKPTTAIVHVYPVDLPFRYLGLYDDWIGGIVDA
ncbi:hypothetical protein Tco_0163728 [Tanacetum coccineum]